MYIYICSFEFRTQRPSIGLHRSHCGVFMSSNNGTRSGPGGSAGMRFERLPEGWESTVDSLGQVYYFNRATHEVQWNRPEGVVPDDPSESGMGSRRGRANSAASTEASDNHDGGPELPRSRRRREGLLAGHGRCGCNCPLLPRRDLGPRHRSLRCRCPFCGHAPAAGGQGCHCRVRADPSSGALVVCRDCAPYCLAALTLAEQSSRGGHRAD